MEGNNKYLGKEKVSKLLLKFSISCILSLLISSLYNIVDQIFIGNSELGYLGNAATSIVFPITIISVAFADGSVAFLSLCQGRKDTKNAHIAIGNGILINFVLSILFVILGNLFMDNLLFLFGASEVTLPLARDYFTIILIFIPVYMMANGMNAIIRADGSPGFSMASTLVGAITNIILDPIFIFVFKWGIAGAADYVLRNNKNLIRKFIYAPIDYRIDSVMEMYKDSKSEAKKNITRADKNRTSYYKLISNNEFGDVNNYDLCIDSSIGVEKTAEVICDFIKNKKGVNDNG